MKKVLVYNRKSRGDLKDLSKHKTELLNYCKNNNFDVTYFEEIGSSVDSSRSEYVKLLNKIESKQYEILVVTDLSRLTRDLETQIKLFKILSSNNMVIHSLLDGNIDPAESNNKMISTIKGLFNESVYEETARKMALGRLQSVKAGKWITSPPFGYKRNKETMKLEIDEKESVIVRRVFDELLQGYSTTEVSVRLYNDGFRSRQGNKIHPSTISDFIRRRSYIGETNYISEYFGEVVRIKDTHEKIVTLEEFIKVGEVLDKRKKFKTRSRPVTSPLDKLVVCGHCGRKMQINFNTGGKYIHLQRCHAFKGNICYNKGCSITHLLPSVYKELKKRIRVIKRKLNELYEGRENKGLEKLQAEQSLVERNINIKEKEKDKLLNFLLNETITDIIYSEKNKELDEEITNLKIRLDDIEELIATNNIENDIEYKEKLLENLTKIEELPVDEQNRILRKVIDKVVYIREDKEIDLKIHFQ